MKAFSAFVLLLLIASVSWAQTSKRLEAADFKTSTNCRDCHEQIYDQWTTSMHSKAYRDPVYQVLLRRVDEERENEEDVDRPRIRQPAAARSQTRRL